MKINKQMRSKIYDKLVYLIELILSILIGVGYYKIAYKLRDFNYISKIYVTLVVISSIMLFAILIINSTRYKEKIENLFLTYLIPIGIMFTILFPAYWAPDEVWHMVKTYDVSVGNIVTPLGEENRGDIYVPAEMIELDEISKNFNYSEIHKLLQIKTDYSNLVSVQTVAKTYAPINYLPGAVTFFICRHLGINILLACYIVKLFNFLIFAIVGYFCIKILPIGKMVMAIYMLLPMIIQQSATLSADSFINCAAMLFIAYNLKLMYQNKDLNVKQKIFYYVLAFSISLSKYIYFPLSFMSLLLIRNKNISKKNRNEVIIFSVCLSLFVSVVWFVFSQQYPELREYVIKRNVKPIEQIKYILFHPIMYVGIFIETLVVNAGYYLFTFVGQELGALNIKLPQIYGMIEIFALVLLPIFEKNDKTLDKHSKWLLNIIAIMMIGLILTGLYLTWTPVGENQISGVQGRYFVPVFILFLFTLIDKNKNIKIKNFELKYFVLYFVLNVLSLKVVFSIFI